MADEETTPLMMIQRGRQGSSTSRRMEAVRGQMRQFLSSWRGHYLVLALVALDVAGIFADFLIALHVCESTAKRRKGFDPAPWNAVLDGLEVASLVFSSLFMVELAACVFAFGLRYFQTTWHIFDATVIVAGFVVDVVLRGTVEEAGSLIVVGRLWRVFKIVEEFSSGAQEELEGLREEVDLLRQKVDEFEAREMGHARR